MIKGIAAPATTLRARRSRQLVKYREKTRHTTPVNSNPGCQHKHEIIDEIPARNGRSLAASNRASIPKRIMGSLGWPPPTVQRPKCCEISKVDTANNDAMRLRK